jgi:hypothetical protein
MGGEVFVTGSVHGRTFRGGREFSIEGKLDFRGVI